MKLSNQSANVTGPWRSLSGEYQVACPGTFGTATVTFRIGVELPDKSIINCAVQTGFSFTSQPDPFLVNLSDEFFYRWEISGVTTGTLLHPIAGKV